MNIELHKEYINKEVEGIKAAIPDHVQVIVKTILGNLNDLFIDDSDDNSMLHIDEVLDRLAYWAKPENWQAELEDSVKCIDSYELIENHTTTLDSECEDLFSTVEGFEEDHNESIDELFKELTELDNYGTDAQKVKFIEDMRYSTDFNELVTTVINKTF